MRQNISFWIKALFVLSLIGIGCGKGFNKDDIKGKLAEPLEADKVTKLKGMPDKKSKDLSTAEQGELADVVFNHLHDKLDMGKFAKAGCHGMAIGNPDKAECEKYRTKCLEEVSKVSAADLKAPVKTNENKIKDFVKQSDYPPKAYVNAFEMLVLGMDTVATLDCGSTKEQGDKALDDMRKQMATKFGAQEATDAEKLIKKLFKLMAPAQTAETAEPKG